MLSLSLCSMPTVFASIRKSWTVVTDALGQIVLWEGWRWLSEWSVALGAWLRGLSFNSPRWRRAVGPQDALAVTLPPLPSPNAGPGGSETDREMWQRRRRLLLAVVREVLTATSLPLRVGLAALVFLVLLPAALGLLVNLVVFVPIWVIPEKTLVLGFSENWIFGVMHLKVWMLFLLLGPRWRLRDRLEEMHDEVLHNWPDLHALRLLQQASPLFVVVGLALSGPYLLAHYAAPRLRKCTLPLHCLSTFFTSYSLSPPIIYLRLPLVCVFLSLSPSIPPSFFSLVYLPHASSSFIFFLPSTTSFVFSRPPSPVSSFSRLLPPLSSLFLPTSPLPSLFLPPPPLSSFVLPLCSPLTSSSFPDLLLLHRRRFLALDISPEVAFRYVYPLVFALLVLACAFYSAAHQCMNLYEKIKDAEYVNSSCQFVFYLQMESGIDWSWHSMLG